MTRYRLDVSDYAWAYQGVATEIFENPKAWFTGSSDPRLRRLLKAYRAFRFVMSAWAFLTTLPVRLAIIGIGLLLLVVLGVVLWFVSPTSVGAVPVYVLMLLIVIAMFALVFLTGRVRRFIEVRVHRFVIGGWAREAANKRSKKGLLPVGDVEADWRGGEVRVASGAVSIELAESELLAVMWDKQRVCLFVANDGASWDNDAEGEETPASMRKQQTVVDASARFVFSRMPDLDRTVVVTREAFGGNPVAMREQAEAWNALV